MNPQSEYMHINVWIIVLKPGSIRRVDPVPGLPGVGTGASWKKIGEEKTQCDPADPATRSKTRLQLVDFFFFLLKRCRFDFFKKLTDPGLGPGWV
jgi:hypothetical protein